VLLGCWLWVRSRLKGLVGCFWSGILRFSGKFMVGGILRCATSGCWWRGLVRLMLAVNGDMNTDGHRHTRPRNLPLGRCTGT